MAKRVRDKEGKKAAIVAAAIDEFATKGYEATYTKEIARLAGCSEAMIFRYFGDKLGLYAIVVADHSRRVLEQAELSLLDDLPPHFHDYVLALFRVRRRENQPPEFVPQFDQIARGLVEPEFARVVFAPTHTARRSAIADAVRHYQDQGDVARDVSPEALAELIGNLVTMTVVLGPRLWGETDMSTAASIELGAAMLARAARDGGLAVTEDPR